MQNDEGNLSDNLVELYKNIKQLCELCTQLKCYKNVTNCYKIVTPTFQKFFSLIQKIPTEQNLSTTYPHSIHTLIHNRYLGNPKIMKGDNYASFR